MTIDTKKDVASPPINAYSLRDFYLEERLQEPGGTIITHDHDFAMLTFILQGGCVESVGSFDYESEPGAMQILPSGHSHSIKFGSKKVRCLSVRINDHKLEAIRQFSSVLDAPSHTPGVHLKALVYRLFGEFRQQDPLAALEIEGLILQALGTFSKRSRLGPAVPKWMTEVQEAIHDQAFERISLTQLASTAEVNPSYLSRAFKKYFGCTIRQYVGRLRIERSMALLVETDWNLAAVAAESGFYDESHLINTFRNSVGMTPFRYRSVMSGSAKTRRGQEIVCP